MLNIPSKRGSPRSEGKQPVGLNIERIFNRIDIETQPHRPVVSQTVRCKPVGIKFARHGHTALAFHGTGKRPNFTIERNAPERNARVISGIRERDRSVLDSEAAYRKIIGPERNR